MGDQKIYQLFYNASGLSGFIIWLGIAICHLRFRKAWVAQGRSLDDLKFKSKFYPYGPWLALILFVVVLFGANISVFQTPGILLVRFHRRLLDDPGLPLPLSGPQVLEQDPRGAAEGIVNSNRIEPPVSYNRKSTERRVPIREAGSATSATF